MQVPDPLACGGRLVDDTGRPHGPACTTARFRAKPTSDPTAPPSRETGWIPGFRPATPDERDEQARAAGWSVGVLPDGTPTAMCPRCRRPNNTAVAVGREIQEGLIT